RFGHSLRCNQPQAPPRQPRSTTISSLEAPLFLLSVPPSAALRGLKTSTAAAAAGSALRSLRWPQNSANIAENPGTSPAEPRVHRACIAGVARSSRHCGGAGLRHRGGRTCPTGEEFFEPHPNRVIVRGTAFKMRLAWSGAGKLHARGTARGPPAHHGVGDFRV